MATNWHKVTFTKIQYKIHLLTTLFLWLFVNSCRFVYIRFAWNDSSWCQSASSELCNTRRGREFLCEMTCYPSRRRKAGVFLMNKKITWVDSGGAVVAARAARVSGRDEDAGMYSVVCASCGAVGPTCAIGRIEANGVSPARLLAVTLCCAIPKKCLSLIVHTDVHKLIFKWK